MSFIFLSHRQKNDARLTFSELQMINIISQKHGSKMMIQLDLAKINACSIQVSFVFFLLLLAKKTRNENEFANCCNDREYSQISFSTFESYSILFRIYARDNRDGIFFFVECERHIILSSRLNAVFSVINQQFYCCNCTYCVTFIR